MLPVPGSRRLRPLALTAALAAGLAALPLGAGGAQAAPTTTVVGKLVQAYPESKVETPAVLAARPLTWVQRPDGTSVRVDTGDVSGIPTGSTVRVRVGGAVRGTAAGESGLDPALSVQSAAVVRQPDPGTSAADAPLTDQVTVVMAYPQGAGHDSATLDQVVTAVNGTVAPFWSAQSGGALRLGVTAKFDWTPVPVDCTHPDQVWVDAAKAVNFTEGPGKHLVVYLGTEPGSLPDCPYGLGEVGSALHAGGSLYVRDTLPSLIAHELGHNFGLGHSSERQCAGAVDDGACRTTPYRDYYDVMGASWERMGALNAAQAARLGVLPAAAQQTVSAGRVGTVTATLAPLAGPAGVRAVRLTDAAGEDYWLEYRTATGQDAWLGSPAADRFGLQSGVLLHRSGDLPDTSLLLDGTPSAAPAWDADLRTALPVGVPVPIAGGQFTVTVQGVSASGATVAITGAPPAAAGGQAPGRGAPAAGPAVLPGSHRSPAPAASPSGSPSTATPAGGSPLPAAATDTSGASAPAASAGRPVVHEAAAVTAAGSSRLLGGGALLLAGTLLAGTVAVRIWSVRRKRTRTG